MLPPPTPRPRRGNTCPRIRDDLSSDLGLGARAIEGLPYFRDRMIDFAFHLFGVHDVFVSDRNECKRKDSEWPLSSLSSHMLSVNTVIAILYTIAIA
jgi:hypothetical protein